METLFNGTLSVAGRDKNTTGFARPETLHQSVIYSFDLGNALNTDTKLK